MKKEAAAKIGIKDIAKQANVSIGTVDRVLHNRSEVSNTTREQVLKIINELGYTPNLLAKSLASKIKYTIAVLIPDPTNNTYWEKPLEGIKAAAREIKKFNFEIQIATFDYSNENSFIEKANEILESNPNGFIFAPVFFESSLKVIEKCDQMELPYVFFDVFIENCKNLAYFGQNSVQSGYLAASLMSYSIDKGTNHIYIVKPHNPSAPVYHLSLRENGFISYFSQGTTNQATIHTMDVDVSSPSILVESLDAIFSSDQKPRGIFVANSRVHLVAQYFEKNKIGNVVLIGYDLLHENIEYLEKGIIQFLICQKPEEQGYKSVFSLYNHLFLKKPVDKVNYSPIDIIMKENIEYYKNFKI
ncbi:MAG: LacI family DNA-binding transcriptional regulator [Bacteroidales bacterium]|nr:LacI family DNA-binding transcriptional regulator [Bacteroidales bacterium]